MLEKIALEKKVAELLAQEVLNSKKRAQENERKRLADEQALKMEKEQAKQRKKQEIVEKALEAERIAIELETERREIEIAKQLSLDLFNQEKLLQPKQEQAKKGKKKKVKPDAVVADVPSNVEKVAPRNGEREPRLPKAADLPPRTGENEERHENPVLKKELKPSPKMPEPNAAKVPQEALKLPKAAKKVAKAAKNSPVIHKKHAILADHPSGVIAEKVPKVATKAAPEVAKQAKVQQPVLSPAQPPKVVKRPPATQAPPPGIPHQQIQPGIETRQPISPMMRHFSPSNDTRPQIYAYANAEIYPANFVQFPRPAVPTVDQRPMIQNQTGYLPNASPHDLKNLFASAEAPLAPSVALFFDAAVNIANSPSPAANGPPPGLGKAAPPNTTSPVKQPGPQIWPLGHLPYEQPQGIKHNYMDLPATPSRPHIGHLPVNNISNQNYLQEQEESNKHFARMGGYAPGVENMANGPQTPPWAQTQQAEMANNIPASGGVALPHFQGAGQVPMQHAWPPQTPVNHRPRPYYQESHQHTQQQHRSQPPQQQEMHPISSNWARTQHAQPQERQNPQQQRPQPPQQQEVHPILNDWSKTQHAQPQQRQNTQHQQETPISNNWSKTGAIPAPIGIGVISPFWPSPTDQALLRGDALANKPDFGPSQQSSINSAYDYKADVCRIADFLEDSW